MRQFVTSNDGTRIAYETAGDGRAALIVLGALNSRKSGTKLAKLLASKFTAVSYDRRGRGDSADSASYAPEREVEDIAALIEAVGGPICLYGHSSGAALAIAAAVKLRKQVTRLAMYEAPYALDGTARKAAQEYHVALKQALSAGHNGDAVALFVRSVGVSDQQVQAMRHMPMWKGLEKLAPTLVYDSEVLGTGHALPRRCRISCDARCGPGDQRSDSQSGTSHSGPPDSWCESKGPRTGTGRVRAMAC